MSGFKWWAVVGRRWRSWSPWRLREALRWQRDWLEDTRTLSASPTDVERLYRHVALTLVGHPDPWPEAMRYSVEGLTLCIDATKEGTKWECVDDSSDTSVNPAHLGSQGSAKLASDSAPSGSNKQVDQ